MKERRLIRLLRTARDGQLCVSIGGLTIGPMSINSAKNFDG